MRSTWWVGHATLLLDAAGQRLVTDPLLTSRVAHLRRRCPPPATDTGDADVVLISHAHLDHLHLPSLRRIRSGARAIVPAATRRLSSPPGSATSSRPKPANLSCSRGWRLAITSRSDSRRSDSSLATVRVDHLEG